MFYPFTLGSGASLYDVERFTFARDIFGKADTTVICLMVSTPKNTQFTPRDGQSRGGDFVNQATTLRFPQSQADATNNIHSSAGLYYSTICKCSPTSKTGIVTDVDGLLVRAN